MKLKKIFISTLAITLILFLFGGLSQQFPWGVPTTQVVFSSERKAEIFASNSKIQKFKANALTTEKFDDQFKGTVSTLTTDKTFNWIVSTDIKNWQPVNYFIREVIIQFFVGLFLSLLLNMSIKWTNNKRLLLILIVALAGTFATYLQQQNWWHIPPSYQFGVMVNLIFSWLLATWISMRLILKTEYDG